MQAREDAIVQHTSEAAQQAAAKAIAANKPHNTIIRQETEREIQTRTVYADCQHSSEQLQRLNEALTGRPSALVVAICPELAPLSDDSFGATTAKLVEVGIQYQECKAAALLSYR